MAYRDYIELDNKKYKVYAERYEPSYDRLRVHTLGITRKTIIQDFGAAPQTWDLKLKVYINDPPDPSWGTWDDLITAFDNYNGVDFIPHNDEESYLVIVDGPLLRHPHVAANIAGLCNGVFDIDIRLTEILMEYNE